MNNLLVQFAIQMTLPYKIPHCIIIVITDIIKDSNIKLRKLPSFVAFVSLTSFQKSETYYQEQLC